MRPFEQAFELAGRIGFDCSANPQAKEFFKHYVEKHAKASSLPGVWEKRAVNFDDNL